MEIALLIVLVIVTFLLIRSVFNKRSLANVQVYDVPELIKNDIELGEGEVAEPGNTVHVHYTGWLYDEEAEDKKGKKFDSSRDRRQAFDFPLGRGRVIRGWDQGVEGMKVGGKRTLIIPANLGYGPRGAGNVIPPNAALVFDVELVRVD